VMGLYDNLDDKLFYTRGILHMLKFCSMEVHLNSRDHLKFWEISANISETVQDRHIVTI